MSILASFPKEKRLYNINCIYDLNTIKVKWESKKGLKLTIDEFNDKLNSSILELKLADNQKIPESKFRREFEHFFLHTKSQMFQDINNRNKYSIDYNIDENSATFTIMQADGDYDIYGIPVASKVGNGGGRPRRRATFRQRRLKRAAAKSRRRTRRTRRV